MENTRWHQGQESNDSDMMGRWILLSDLRQWQGRSIDKRAMMILGLAYKALSLTKPPQLQTFLTLFSRQLG